MPIWGHNFYLSQSLLLFNTGYTALNKKIMRHTKKQEIKYSAEPDSSMTQMLELSNRSLKISLTTILKNQVEHVNSIFKKLENFGKVEIININE